jgi:hypothetical protein
MLAFNCNVPVIISIQLKYILLFEKLTFHYFR